MKLKTIGRSHPFCTIVAPGHHGSFQRTERQVMIRGLAIAILALAGCNGNSSSDANLSPAAASVKGLGGTFSGGTTPDQPLTVIRLGRTETTDGHLEKLADQTQLQELQLLDTSISDAGLAHLKSMTELTSLKTLKLQGTKVTGAGLQHLAGLTSLESLNLNGTVIDDEGMAVVKGLASLTELDLGKTGVGNDGLQYLDGAPELYKLWLQGTQISADGLAHLARISEEGHLTHLHEMDLRGTQIDDESLVHVRGLTSLRILHVGETKVTREGAASLLPFMPHCFTPPYNRVMDE